MILSEDSPFYKDLPGLSVLLGGMWIMNISYWGFNQYIIQRALAAKNIGEAQKVAAKNIGEAQKGVLFAAFLKLLMPVIVVLPGIAAVVLAPDLAKPDQAYPTVMHLLPNGILGLVFAALVAAIVASLASKINSVATIFTLDFYAKGKAEQDQQKLVKVGRIAAATAVLITAVLIGILAAKPLLGSFDQAFQYIQEYTGFFTPGGDLHARFVLETRQRSRCAGCRHRLLRAVHRAEAGLACTAFHGLHCLSSIALVWCFCWRWPWRSAFRWRRAMRPRRTSFVPMMSTTPPARHSTSARWACSAF